MTIERIYIERDFSEDAAFGGETANIDVDASFDRLENMQVAALREHYPGADITFKRSNIFKTFVDGEAGSYDCQEVDAILQDVWGSFDWVVHV